MYLQLEPDFDSAPRSALRRLVRFRKALRSKLVRANHDPMFLVGIRIVAVVCALVLYAAPALAKNKHTEIINSLLVVDPKIPGWQGHQAWEKYRGRLRALKANGETTVNVDVWWGLIQPNSPDEFDWEYIDLVLRVIREEGLDYDLIDSRHQLGGNVGDTNYISVPLWHLSRWKENSEHADLAFISEAGHRSEEAVSVWGVPYVIDDMKRFWRALRDRYKPKKLTLGAFAASETLMPSYHLHDRSKKVGHAFYPGRGVLQASSPLAQQDLRRELKEKYGTIDALNEAWKDSGVKKFESFESLTLLTTTEEADDFFAHNREYTAAGQDFFDWYHGSLIRAVLRIGMEAGAEFQPAEGQPAVTLSFKIPGIHWDFLTRRPQLAAGLLTTRGAVADESLPLRERQPADWKLENGNGYRDFFSKVIVPLRAKFPRIHWELIFTCGEMADCHAECMHRGADAGCHCSFFGKPAFSGAYTLVDGIGNLADQFRVPTTIENALGGNVANRAMLDNMESHLRKHPYFVAASLLRVDNVAETPEALDFLRRVRSIEQAELSCPDRILMLNGVPSAG